MPRSFFGIGTSYIGHKNAVIEPGLCEHCGRMGDMYTFDTTECFTFLYIPLAPLGKRRIIKECPYCGHHLIKKYRNLGDFQTIAGIISIYLFLFVLILASSYRLSKHRQVFFINGLQRPYQININGVELDLPAEGPVTARLPEGEITIRMPAEGLASAAVTVKLEYPLLNRILDNRTYVINPDGVGVLLWEKTPYMTDRIIKATEVQNALDTKLSKKYPEYEYKIYAGKHLYEFENLDYEFEVFPEKVTIEGDVECKTGVSQLTDYDPSSVLYHLVDSGEIESALCLARNHLSFTPAETSYLNYLAAFSPAEECIAFLQPRLSDRPVLVEWHRLYQNLVEQENPHYDLAAEYQAYLDKEPDNSDLQYLLGRITQDPEKAATFYKQACAKGKENAYAYYALASQALSSGEFTAAYDYINKAITKNPNVEAFVYLKDRILEALGEYRALLAKNDLYRKNDPYSGELVAEAIRLNMQDGREKQAVELIRNYLTFLEEEAVDSADTWDNYLQSVYYYCLDDLPNYQSYLAKVDPKAYGFTLALSAGDPDEAAAALAQTPNPAHTDYLLLYLLAESSGQAQYAAVYLEEAIKRMTYSNDQRYLAACLGGTSNPDPDRIRHMCLDVTEKKIILTTFGVKFPQHREEFLRLACTLNYEKKFPYHFLRSIQEKYGNP
mgnify:CR=1 FL=1